MDGAIIPNIADELVLNILMRLPVKSLKRFSCVNKWWYNLIHSPYFISRHYSHHSSFNHKLLVKSSPSNFTIEQDVICLLSENDGDSSRLSTRFLNQRHKVKIMGPCINGIICLKIFTIGESFADIALWNVATGDYNILPKLQFNAPPKAYLEPDIGGLGFGWVPETSEFKVIVGINFWQESCNHYDYIPYYRPSEFFVYTLSSNSWKQLRLEFSFLTCHLKSDPPFHSQIYFNGVCYWVNRTIDKIYKIFTFHVRDEVFGTLQLPYIETPQHGHLSLTLRLCMLDGCIALVNDRSDVGRLHFFVDIWVMEESWIKKFEIGPLLNIQAGLGLVKDEYFLEDDSGHLLSINVNSHKIKNCGIQGGKYSIQVLEYMESLVSIKRCL